MEKMTRFVNDNRGPTGSLISWSVRTFTLIMFRGLDLLDGISHHAVKVLTYLANVAREKFLELVHTKLQLEEMCKEKKCESLMEINLNNRIQVMGVLQFIIFGADKAIQEKKRLIEASFNMFFKLNSRYIRDRVDKFSVAPK